MNENEVLDEMDKAMDTAERDMEQETPYDSSVYVGEEQLKSRKYEKDDITSKSSIFAQSSLSKLLRRIGSWVSLPIAFALNTIRRAVIAIAMPKKQREQFYKTEEEKMLVEEKNKTRETAAVANQKMQIITNDKLTDREKLNQLATLCHRSGCTFNIILNDMSAIQFMKNDRHVEIYYSDSPRVRGKNNVETYLFGTSFGKVTFSANGDILNRMPFKKELLDSDLDAVEARVKKSGGFNKEVDSLKATAIEDHIENFNGLQNRVTYDQAIESTTEEINPGHDNKDVIEQIKEEIKDVLVQPTMSVSKDQKNNFVQLYYMKDNETGEVKTAYLPKQSLEDKIINGVLTVSIAAGCMGLAIGKNGSKKEAVLEQLKEAYPQLKRIEYIDEAKLQKTAEPKETVNKYFVGSYVEKENGTIHTLSIIEIHDSKDMEDRENTLAVLDSVGENAEITGVAFYSNLETYKKDLIDNNITDEVTVQECDKFDKDIEEALLGARNTAQFMTNEELTTMLENSEAKTGPSASQDQQVKEPEAKEPEVKEPSNEQTTPKAVDDSLYVEPEENSQKPKAENKKAPKEKGQKNNQGIEI